MRAIGPALRESQVRRLLGLETRFQVHALLKERNVSLRFSEADLQDDLRTQGELGVIDSSDWLNEQDRAALHQGFAGF